MKKKGKSSYSTGFCPLSEPLVALLQFLPNKFVRTKMRLKEGTKIEFQREILASMVCNLFGDVLQGHWRLSTGLLQGIWSQEAVS